MNKVADFLNSVLRSRQFFYATIIFLVFEALWMVFSAVYPMAFDEDFHFGLIKIYSHHWLPFLDAQPPDADAFGAVARDPSYLFHYIMSFPYRLIALFVHGQTGQVIILRLFNIAFFVLGLVLFRRLLLRVNVSSALTNVSIAIFALIPIAPQLAAHISYDNLLLPMVPAVLLLVIQAHDGILKKRIDFKAISLILTLSLLASLVKYAYLPVFAAIGIFLVITVLSNFRGDIKLIRLALTKSFKSLPHTLKIGLLVILCISGGLFIQRYGLNAVAYKSPIPSCDDVLSIDHCSAYGPWNRDYISSQNKGEFNHSPFLYAKRWFYWLWYRLFFAVNGPASQFATYRPLPVPSKTAAVLGIVSASLVLVWGLQISKDARLRLFLFVIIIYAGALWLENYSLFSKTGQPVAINGRYLLPVLLLAAAIAGKAFSLTLAGIKWLKPLLASAVILLFLSGGGIFTFIMRSDSSWDWPNRSVITTNDTARRYLKPIIIEGEKFQ